MNKEIWNIWKNNWIWILNIAKQREWDIVDDLTVKPPVSYEDVLKKQNELGVVFPKEFVEVLLNYSASVDFYFQIEGEETEGVYREVFSAGDQLWAFDLLTHLKENYDGWVRECFNDPSNEYDKVWQHKLPFIHVPNGDFIAFDISHKAEECPVIYLSHDGDDMHGARLGYNFVDFITRWSNVGCFGPECWQFEPFYDKENNILLLDAPIIKNWKEEFLNKSL